MLAIINPSHINGIITAPASKSAMQRACALGLLNKGKTVIQNPGQSNDDKAAIRIIEDLGANVSFENGDMVIVSRGEVRAKEIIHCGESGLSFRMFAPVAALSESTVTISGSGSLLKRPMHFIDETFPQLNVKISSNNGFLPISFSGPLQPNNITIDGSLSSQYLTGLLFSFAAATEKQVAITVNNLKSRPYIDLSLQMLHHFGYEVHNDEYIHFDIIPSSRKERDIVYYTEADWSSASFLLVAGAIAGNIEVKGLSLDSVQADREVLTVLQNAGADIRIENEQISVSDSNVLKAFEFDATDCPDLFPPLATLAANCYGTSAIKGVSRLACKESNRAETLVDVFTRMGIEISFKEDTMTIIGGTGIHGTTVSSHHDHRIAMACAVAGLVADTSMLINNAEAINKSYPGFYNDLSALGASISLQDQ